MKKALTAITLVAAIVLSTSTVAEVFERINFAKGSINHTWSGIIKDGEKVFKLRLREGQTLSVSSGDVYTWYAISPIGYRLGCNGTTYCSSGNQMWLQESGDYKIVTDYRMSSGWNDSPSKTRKVIVGFGAW